MPAGLPDVRKSEDLPATEHPGFTGLRWLDVIGPGCLFYRTFSGEGGRGLVATKVHVNAIGTALGAFVPGGGLVKVTATGSIAVESRGIATDTGQLELAWKYREKDRASVFSLADFNWYSHSRSAVDDWADQLVEAWNTPIDHKIDDSLPFTWRPW